MNDIRITAQELYEMNCPVLPQKAKDFSNSSFWHYTTLGTANSIFQNECIYVGNLSTMNDLDESELHKDKKEFVHCLCFCNSNTEKIPLWYLYSGISGQGVALGLTSSVMLELIKSIQTLTTLDGAILRKGEDFDVDYGWVYYRKKEENTQIFFKRKWYSLIDPEKFEENNYFIKSYPWEYEKEFRIVFINKTSKSYEKLVVSIGPILKKIKLKLAPELKIESLTGMLPNLSGLAKFLLNKVLCSELSINMKLFKRNYESFVEYIKADLAVNDMTPNYCELCEAISGSCKWKRKKSTEVK